MPKPLIVSSEFPTTEGIEKDSFSLKIISPAYAGSGSELTAILQYFYHYFHLNYMGYEEEAIQLEQIAIAEMLHLELLGKTIIALGAQPVYTANPPWLFNFFSTKYVSYSCRLQEMIEDDVIAERRAIGSYQRMLKYLRNKKVSAIIAHILEDEKLHLSTLEEILKTIRAKQKR